MIKKDQKKQKVKKLYKKLFVNIPPFGEIRLGTVPSSGATVSFTKISKEFKKAAKDKIFPPPQDYGYPEALNE